MNKPAKFASSVMFSVLFAAGYAQAEPKYAAEMPQSVTTPDIVETETLGDLTFFDGMPSKESV